MRDILKSHSGTHSGTSLKRLKIAKKWQFWRQRWKIINFFHAQNVCKIHPFMFLFEENGVNSWLDY